MLNENKNYLLNNHFIFCFFFLFKTKKTMIATSNNNNHAELPQTPRSLSKSHDDGDVKYFFQRPEQELNSRQNSKWSGDDTVLEQVLLFYSNKTNFQVN